MIKEIMDRTTVIAQLIATYNFYIEMSLEQSVLDYWSELICIASDKL